jgi:hypothetical protein
MIELLAEPLKAGKGAMGRRGTDEPAAENIVPEPDGLARYMDHPEGMLLIDAGDCQTHRVRTHIYRGNHWHGRAGL